MRIFEPIYSHKSHDSTYNTRNLYCTCTIRREMKVIYVPMLAYTTRESKCQYGSPCRDLQILLVLLVSALQRMSAKHSLGSWFYSWSIEQPLTVCVKLLKLVRSYFLFLKNKVRVTVGFYYNITKLVKLFKKLVLSTLKTCIEK